MMEDQLCSRPDTNREPAEYAKRNYIAFDDIIRQVGSFGRYQIRTFIMASFFDVPLAWFLLFFMFGGANPGWYCLTDGETKLLQNVSMEDKPQIVENTTGLWAEGVCAINGTKCDSIVFKGGLTSLVTEFSLVCENGYTITLCTTLLMVGVLVGAIVGGQLADMYGRRPVVITASTLLILCQLVQSFCPNWQVFAAIRFAGGISAGAEMIIIFVIPMEIIGERWRTLCGCIGFWQVGSICFGGLAYLVPHWRHLSITTAMIASPLLLSFFVIKESPRWLVQKKRLPDASRIIRQMARQNGRPLPEESALYNVSTRDNQSTRYSLKHLFRNRPSTFRTLLLYQLWFTCASAYYGLSMMTTILAGNIFINIVIMGVAELLISVTVIYTASRMGRRPALMMYLSLATVCLACAVTLSVTKSIPVARSIIAAFGRANVIAAWNIASLLTAELFPTVVRSLGTGSSSMVGRLGGILAPIIAYLTVVHEVIPSVIFLALILSCLVSVFLVLPETKGKNLPDVLPPKRGCCAPEGDSH